MKFRIKAAAVRRRDQDNLVDQSADDLVSFGLDGIVVEDVDDIGDLAFVDFVDVRVNTKRLWRRCIERSCSPPLPSSSASRRSFMDGVYIPSSMALRIASILRITVASSRSLDRRSCSAFTA